MASWPGLTSLDDSLISTDIVQYVCPFDDFSVICKEHFEMCHQSDFSERQTKTFYFHQIFEFLCHRQLNAQYKVLHMTHTGCVFLLRLFFQFFFRWSIRMCEHFPSIPLNPLTYQRNIPRG